MREADAHSASRKAVEPAQLSRGPRPAAKQQTAAGSEGNTHPHPQNPPDRTGTFFLRSVVFF